MPAIVWRSGERRAGVERGGERRGEMNRASNRRILHRSAEFPTRFLPAQFDSDFQLVLRPVPPMQAMVQRLSSGAACC